jgi:hypothetical protein
MSSASFQTTLDTCTNGLNQLKAIVRSNQVLVDAYNTDKANYKTSYDAQLTTYNTNKQTRQNAQTDWDNKRDAIKTDLRDVTKGAGRGLCGTNPGCPSGWHWYQNDNKLDCEQICKRNVDTLDNDSNTQAVNDNGNRPSDFNDPQPQNNPPTPPAQNTTNVQIKCCANLTNIIGSEITDSTISQQNSCMESLKTQLNQAKANEDAVKVTSTTPSATTSAATQVQDKIDKLNKTTNSTPTNSNNIKYLIAGGGVLFCCCMTILILVVVIMSSGND